MDFEKREGAAVNGAQEKERSELILTSNGKPVKDDAHLARCNRRKLKPHGETLRKIDGSYYNVSIQDWHRIDLRDQAIRLGVARPARDFPSCGLCSTGAARTVVDGMPVCHGCESELKGGAL